ncbi:hypothetical protein [Aurantibacter aestuarii]|uniref:GLPGLI family protein n=1 Tax=Aurantibacter aestuarii TaxID=1266046 RepID=A0A2T1NBY7_9FLAO|nr:hypothetical protein [Aurantibacter aestuarii]PSG89940.1 hypothetical protein C7H52_01330 [Aurantibacter aestuarii]
MKKSIIIISLLLVSVLVTAQDKIRNSNELYIYIENTNFISGVLSYNAYFSIPSIDKRFQGDNYYFNIDYRGLDYKSLFSLGNVIDINTIEYVNPITEFKSMSNCELHNLLSLYKRIYIITDIPKSKLISNKDSSKKHILWYTNYNGTQKDVVHTNITGQNFIDE